MFEVDGRLRRRRYGGYLARGLGLGRSVWWFLQEYLFIFWRILKLIGETK